MKHHHLIFLALLAGVQPVFAETAEEKGYAIQAEASRRDNGFADSMHDAIMTLRNAQGAVSTREFVVKTLEVEGDG
ncbi:MAG: hypothetical protein RI993_1379, partial [Pseudomonadota bacterium]